MEFVKPFLVEITEELLYNIVHSGDAIDYDTLSKRFEEKTRHKPMDFFGFGNVTEQRWLDFIRDVPGLVHSSINIVSINHDNHNINEKHDKRASVYRQNNTTYTSDSGLESIAAYREKFLILSCEMIKDAWGGCVNEYDSDHTTPLHLIAALPGHYVEGVYMGDTVSLVKYLLQAGVDPLESNKDGQNFLHTICCRFREEWAGDEEIGRMFTNERFAYLIQVLHNLNVVTLSPYLWEREAILNLLSDELTPGQLASLVNAQDYKGDTVIHEWAEIISILNVGRDSHSVMGHSLLETLLQLGHFYFPALLRTQNDSGNVALHYAFHPEVFKILRQNDLRQRCQTRNDLDETPVLLMLKCLVKFAFADTSAKEELADLVGGGFRTIRKKISIKEATTMLEQFTDLVAGTDDTLLRKTLWIPDNKGNCTVDVILIAIRLGSYHVEENNVVLEYSELLKCLVELLSRILPYADTNDMKRPNCKGQSALHVLLDMGDGNKNILINDEYILHSMEILLKHNADVSAVDLEGHTPVDVSYKYHCRRPSLYKKCAELLINHGAHVVPPWDNSASPTTSRQSQDSHIQPSLLQDITRLRLDNERRKLRSCPKSHLNNAQHLIDINSKVTVVGRYRYSNQDPIGSGAFSLIFVAVKDEHVDSKSGTINYRAYALKRMEKARMDPAEIEREINTLLSISGKCENIIKYHDSFKDDFFQYISLDLMDGDLNEFVTNNGVNELRRDSTSRVRVSMEIINGLAFLHELNFIHRDLKPGNILYTTDPTLHFKIADFGLTKNMSTSSTPTRGSGVAMAPGTRCWVAPELISMKSSEHTKESDIFSLGLVFYFLTLGKHPFATESEEPPYIIEGRIVDMQIRRDLTFQPEAGSFLQQLLRKDPSKRTPAKFLNQHPFLWSEGKKIEFLKAVGDQPEAATPASYSNSALEQRLQMTNIGQNVQRFPWDRFFKALFAEMTRSWKKKYRTDKVIDLLRFIRNAYAHKQERSLVVQSDLNSNIFLHEYPSLVLDVFGVVQNLGFLNDLRRSNIQEVLS